MGADMDKSRRTFLAFAAVTPFAVLASGRALAADSSCYNPAALPSAQKSMRDSLEFKGVSNDPKRHCSLCAFYKETAPGCGTCELLTGGPVSANSVCDSWAAKG